MLFRPLSTFTGIHQPRIVLGIYRVQHNPSIALHAHCISYIYTDTFSRLRLSIRGVPLSSSSSSLLLSIIVFEIRVLLYVYTITHICAYHITEFFSATCSGVCQMFLVPERSLSGVWRYLGNLARYKGTYLPDFNWRRRYQPAP